MSESGPKRHNGETLNGVSPPNDAPSAHARRSRRATSLRAHLTYLTALLVIVPALVSGLVLGLGARGLLQQQVFRHLQDVCDGKAQEMTVVLESWLATVDLFSHRPLLLDGLAVLGNPQSPASTHAEAFDTLNWMMFDLSHKLGQRIGDAYVLDARTLRPLAWDGFRSREEVVLAARQHSFSDLSHYQRPAILEPYLDPKKNQINVDIVRVLRYKDDKGPTHGLLVLRLNVPAVLYPIVDHVSALGKSAEAQILDQRQRLLKDHRHHPGSLMKTGGPLSVGLARTPDTITRGPDYRGVMALAAQAEIPLTGWTVTYKVDAAEALAGVRKITALWAIIVALVLVGGLLVALRTAHQVADPVLKLSAAARRVADGELETRVHLARQDELGALADDFNYMAERMVVSRDELEQQVRARTAELTTANENLRRMNEEMTSFTYSVSHDLSSPLVSLQGLSGMLIRDYSDKLGEEGLRRLHRLQANVESMQALVVDLLELSRIGRVTGQYADLDPTAVAGQVIGNLSDLIAEVGAEVTVTGEQCPLVHADTNRMRQVFSNLLGNSIKYRDPSRPLRIEVNCEANAEGMAEIVVTDNGTGIAEQYHERVFLPFQRLPESRKVPGTGMGLAIVRKIVEYHGGHVWVESKAGEGAAFHITLPKAGDPNGRNSETNPAG